MAGYLPVCRDTQTLRVQVPLPGSFALLDGHSRHSAPLQRPLPDRAGGTERPRPLSRQEE